MPGALLAEHRERGLGDVDDAKEVGVDLSAEILERDVLDRREVGVPGVVDDDVDPSEVLDAGGDRRLRRGGIGDIEGERQDPVAVGGDQVVERSRVASGGDQPIAAVEHGLGDRAAEATAGAGEKEHAGHSEQPPNKRTLLCKR